MASPASDDSPHPHPEPTEPEVLTHHNTPADLPQSTAELLEEDALLEPAARRSSKAHTGWEATGVAMARCDFCQLASRGVVQKCSTCKLSICKECFDNGRLINDPNHNIGHDDNVSWEPLAKTRVSKKGAARRGRNRAARGRVSRKRTARASGTRASKSLTRTLLKDAPEDTPSQLSEPAPRDHHRPRVCDQELLNGASLPEEEPRRLPSVVQLRTSNSAEQCSGQLPYAYPTQEESRGPFPSVRFLAPPSTRYLALPCHRERPPPPNTSSNSPGVQRVGKYGPITGYRLHDTPGECFEDSTSSPQIIPRIADFSRNARFHNEYLPRMREAPPRSREPPEWERVSDRYFPAARPVHSGVHPLPDCGYRQQPFAEYQHDTRERVSPRSPRIYAHHEYDHPALASPAIQALHNVPPAPTLASDSPPPLQPPTRGLSDWTERPRTERPETAYEDEWPHRDELQGLASYLMESAILMRHHHPEWPPLDWCLRHEVAAEWATGKLRRIFPDDGEAYRFLLGATYIASVTLQLDSRNNAVREWLCEQERVLCEQGRPPIRHLPTKCFLPVD